MSQSYQRHEAVRVLATELETADYHFKETDEDKAPEFLLLPSGQKANRVMVGGTVLSVEDSSSDGDSSFWKARVEDSTGQYLLFAGQYQPEAASVLRSIHQDSDKPPAFVNVVGKTTEYRPEDDESEVIVNIRPESISVVDDVQRENWLKETCSRTIERLENQEGEFVRKAEERYGDRSALLRDDIMGALESLE